MGVTRPLPTSQARHLAAGGARWRHRRYGDALDGCTIWYMRYEQTIGTTADLARAWTALATVTTWPQWTKSMTAVQPLDGGDLRVGDRFRVRQPGLPPVVWRVATVRDGESFTWENSSLGVRTVAFHRLDVNEDGTTRITIGLEQSGPLSGVIHALLGRKTRRYLAMEAAALKAASEATTTRDPDQA